MQIRYLLIVFYLSLSLSLFIYILISPLRGGYIVIGSVLDGPQLSMLVGYISYFFFTYYTFRLLKNRTKEGIVLAIIILGKSCLEIPIRLMNFDGTLISLLDSCTQMIGILSGFIYFKISKKYLKFTFITFYIMLGLWLTFLGHNFWHNYLNFKTFTGRVSGIIIPDFSFQSSVGNTLNLNYFKNKYLLVDCWYTNCGICYIKMPKVQKLYDKYKENPDIQVYALHARMEDKKETYLTGSEILKKKGYYLPVLSINIEDKTLRELGVKVYPTVLIFDKNSE